MTIHWCGTGLSAIPGLRKLIENGHDVTVWNRTIEKAQDAVDDLTTNIRAFDLDALTEAMTKDDVVVSMLPGDWHVPVAKAALSKGAHFVSSSYIAPDMRALDAQAKDLGLCVMNEVGLDPGIDHVMAHWLVADYRASDAYDPKAAITFKSYCGGVPKISNAFRYKFSWAPLGVLKALKSPSTSIKEFSELNVARPWDAISTYTAPLPQPEAFEVYPNRDSLPFMQDYAFDSAWPVREFVRGTLRLNGWKDAWADVFTEIETLKGPAGDARMAEMADQFWAENSYEDGEPDRVIMCVELKAETDGNANYHKTYVMDAWGDERGTAMARLVSIPVALAVEAVVNREIPVGVTAAPSDPKLITRWMNTVDTLAQFLEIVGHS